MRYNSPRRTDAPTEVTGRVTVSNDDQGGMGGMGVG
jgi:hypothetical protein